MIEIRRCEESAEAVAAFLNETSGAAGGDYVTQRYSAELLLLQLAGSEDERDLWLAAYDDGRLIGTLLMRELGLRLRGRPLRCSLGSGLVVRSEYRGQGIGRRLLSAGRALHRERELDFELGFIDTGHEAKRLWHRQPDVVSLGFLRWWTRVLDEKRALDWMLEPSQRLFVRGLSLLPRFREDRALPRTEDPCRAAQPKDLFAAIDLVNEAGQFLDLQIDWNQAVFKKFFVPTRVSRTLVWDLGGRPTGLLSYHLTEEVGRTVGLSANVELLALQRLPPAEARDFLRSAFRHMRNDGALFASVLGQAGSRPGLYLSCGMFPLSADVEAVAVFVRPGLRLEGIRRMQVVYR